MRTTGVNAGVSGRSALLPEVQRVGSHPGPRSWESSTQPGDQQERRSPLLFCLRGQGGATGRTGEVGQWLQCGIQGGPGHADPLHPHSPKTLQNPLPIAAGPLTPYQSSPMGQSPGERWECWPWDALWGRLAPLGLAGGLCSAPAES